MRKVRRIISGDIVRLNSAEAKKVSPRKASLLGIVGYAPYNFRSICVTWPRRVRHDIIQKSKLSVVLTKKQTQDVVKLVQSRKP